MLKKRYNNVIRYIIQSVCEIALLKPQNRITKFPNRVTTEATTAVEEYGN